MKPTDRQTDVLGLDLDIEFLYVSHPIGHQRGERNRPPSRRLSWDVYIHIYLYTHTHHTQASFKKVCAGENGKRHAPPPTWRVSKGKDVGSAFCQGREIEFLFLRPEGDYAVVVKKKKRGCIDIGAMCKVASSSLSLFSPLSR